MTRNRNNFVWALIVIAAIAVVAVIALYFWKGKQVVQPVAIVPVKTFPACMFDPAKRVQDCECPTLDADASRPATCLIHDENGSLQIVDTTAVDGPVFLAFFDYAGTMLSKGIPQLNTSIGFSVDSIQKLRDHVYVVDFSNSRFRTEGLLVGHVYHRFLFVSFERTPYAVDITRRDVIRPYQRSGFQSGTYTFDTGTDPKNPTFILGRVDFENGTYTKIVDLTSAIKGASFFTDYLKSEAELEVDTFTDVSGNTVLSLTVFWGDEKAEYYSINLDTKGTIIPAEFPHGGDITP